MRIAFFVNSIEGEHPRYTTTALALAALTRGHDICYLTPGDFVLRPDDSLLVRARKLPGTTYKKVETLYQALQGDEAVVETIDVREIDVLMLRSDPSQDAAERPWAANAGPMFGRLAVARGVLVLNDPDGLALAQNKLYLQGFPQAVRPASLISKSIDEIRAFIDEQPGGAILKPLQGSGGRNVFKIGSSGDSNLNQIFEAVSGEGYLVVQSYIPEAVAGDVRLFLMNGTPLRHDGKLAAMRRVPAEGEHRSNLHASGTAEKVKLSEHALAVAEMVRPKLVQDGLFLVGLDLVGDKILEINVFTPGGLLSIGEMYRTDFVDSIVQAVESKLEIRSSYRDAVSNRVVATL
jgi:glutathione synthase